MLIRIISGQSDMVSKQVILDNIEKSKYNYIKKMI